MKLLLRALETDLKKFPRTVIIREICLEGCLLFSHGSKIYSSGKSNGESHSKDDMSLSACTEQGPFINITITCFLVHSERTIVIQH